MARRAVVTLSGNVSLQDLGQVVKGSIVQIGGSSFGGGTLTLFVSFDGGVTKNAFKDGSGAAYSTTANDTFTFDFGKFRDSGLNGVNLGMHLYVTVAGSTSPTSLS